MNKLGTLRVMLEQKSAPTKNIYNGPRHYSMKHGYFKTPDVCFGYSDTWGYVSDTSYTYLKIKFVYGYLGNTYGATSWFAGKGSNHEMRV